MQKNTLIDNDLYNTLGERWYTAFDDPVAVLRAESRVKAPWVLERIKAAFPQIPLVKHLDVGCGAGFLSNHLAQEGLQVTGLDMSEESLKVAGLHDSTGTVRYVQGDAYRLPFSNETFDVVSAMDFLEHVEDPGRAISEMSRVLKPNGLLFFHTFNRNWLAHLVIIKLVEFLVKNTPKNMHVIELFITPEELIKMCKSSQLNVQEMTGIRPRFSTLTVKSILTGIVPEKFSFKLTRSLKLSYMGVARKART
jgi:2-polyprenyl-6-hydroxyphenyl methylase/3-demethylubiquinone-9 3-methyltransferase